MKLQNMKLNQNKRPPDSERLLKKEQDGEQKKVYRPQQRKKLEKHKLFIDDLFTSYYKPYFKMMKEDSVTKVSPVFTLRGFFIIYALSKLVFF
jgi:hypothetical protein